MKEQPPGVRPNEELWSYCRGLGEKYEISPLEVLKRLVLIGKYVTKINERGGEVVARMDGREIQIKAFKS